MAIQELIEEFEAGSSRSRFSCFEEVHGHRCGWHRRSSFEELRHSVDARQHVHDQVPGGVGT